MALTIEFETAGADAGVFTVGGLGAEVGPEVLAAVQRTDDGRWLTLHGRWGPDASWFPCPRLDASAGATRFATAPPLAAGLLAARSLDLRVQLRRFDFTDTGPLSWRTPETPEVPGPEPASGPGHKGMPAAAGRTAPIPPGGAPTADGPAAEEAPARRALPVRPFAIGTAVLATAALVWALLPGGSLPGGSPPGTAPPAPAATTAGPARPTGRALAAALKARGLSPADLFREAEAAEQAHDCDAAIRLFVDAAKAQAALAERLAGRYDPEGFVPSHCILEPSADSAQRWYREAAEQGLPRSQRRFGELLLAEGRDGPVYRDALEWLRRAAAAGDQTAAGRLGELGEP